MAAAESGLVGNWQADDEGGALARLALDQDAAAMRIDEMLVMYRPRPMPGDID